MLMYKALKPFRVYMPGDYIEDETVSRHKAWVTQGWVKKVSDHPKTPAVKQFRRKVTPENSRRTNTTRKKSSKTSRKSTKRRAKDYFDLDGDGDVDKADRRKAAQLLGSDEGTE